MSVEVKDDLVTLGKKFYEEKLKAILEPEHNGEFVAIEPYLEKYFLDKNEVQVMLKAHQQLPESKFYFVRIGYQFANKIGGSWLKKKQGFPIKIENKVVKSYFKVTKLKKVNKYATLSRR